MKRTVLALFLGLILLLSACGQKEQTSAPAVSPDTGSGVLSAFAARDLNGNAVDQSILKGKKLTVVNVWATFCGPCLGEMPELQALSEEMAPQGVQVIGVVVDAVDRNFQPKSGILEDARAIAAQTGAAFPSLIPSRDLAALCGVQSVPTTIFVDENGRQVGETFVGARNLAQWRALVTKALEGLS